MTRDSFLFDSRISFKAKALFGQMLALTEDGICTIPLLMQHNKERTGAIRAGVRELEIAGYVSRCHERDAQGRFRGVTYQFNLTPKGGC